MSRDQALDATIVATDVDRTWGRAARVEGPVAAIAAWLTVRRLGLRGDVPPVPAWLV